MHLCYNGTGRSRGRAFNGARCVTVADDSFPVLALCRPVPSNINETTCTSRRRFVVFVVCFSAAVLAVVLYWYNKIEISHNGRREINRMCKKISRYLRHESYQVLGQQLQVIFVEENIRGDERKMYVEFCNFI
jgi:hypothetical protein